MPDLWYRALLRTVSRIYYRRVHVVDLSGVDTSHGPVLFVGLHRNGAVDGMLYKSAFPRAVFVIARQLLRTWFSRLYFTGIPVTREKDDDSLVSRRENPHAIAAAVDHLVGGGALFVLPEGTSDLGPRHLPFKAGAAKVLAAALDRGATPLVIPVGIFYECAPAFRSDVCIVVGAPVDVGLPPATDDRRSHVSTLMARITAALEAIAVEAEDTATLRRIETMATLGVEEMDGARWQAQKALTRHVMPEHVRARWERLSRDMGSGRLALDRAGVPRWSRHGVLWSACWLVLQTAIVSAALGANLLPVLGAWIAGRRFADARNTIALWRVLIGAPLAMMWMLGILVIALATGAGWIVPAYVACSIAGLVTYPELCRRWPMLRNGFGRLTSRADARVVARWVRERSDEDAHSGAHVTSEERPLELVASHRGHSHV